MDIVVVGGGTAGWITAYGISEAHPEKHNITLIESSQIGIIGAGEGSTGLMLKLLTGGSNGWVKRLIDIDDFMKQTDSVNKMGIKYENWSPSRSSYFSPILTSITDHLEDDYIFKPLKKDKKYLQSKDGYRLVYKVLKHLVKKNNTNWYDLRSDGFTKEYLATKLRSVLHL
jgi:hypothetical protein